MTRNTILGIVKDTYSNDGLKGFYKGWCPPLIGSMIFRSLQFSAYEASFTKCESSESMRQTIPHTGGLELRVICGGLISGTCRSLVECPFEYAKVKGQTSQAWVMKDIYKGFTNLYPRSTILMTSYFIQVDYYRRHTKLFETKLGQFYVSGSSAMVGFWIIWPFEVLKNMAQAETKDCGNTTLERVKYILRTRGPLGFYRGIIPGSQSVFFRNGAGFIVMQYAQKKLTQMGLRD